MGTQSASKKAFGKILSVVLCAALLMTTYSGFFGGMRAAAGAVDLAALSPGEVGVNKTVVQNGRGADLVIETAAKPFNEVVTGQTTTKQALDVVVIIDTSSSMVNSKVDGKTVLDNVKIAANELVTSIYELNSENRVALGTFNGKAYVCGTNGNNTEYPSISANIKASDFYYTSSNANGIKNRINGLSTSSGTNTEGGMLVAETLAKLSPADRNTLIVFMTDGLPTARYKDNGTKLNSAYSEDSTLSDPPSYLEFKELLDASDSASQIANTQIATVFFTGGLNSNDSYWTNGLTSYKNDGNNSVTITDPAKLNNNSSDEQRLMSGFFKKNRLEAAQYIVSKMEGYCEAGVYMPEDAKSMLQAFKDIVTNYTNNNLYKPASNAYYEDIVPDYAEVVESTLAVSMGNVTLLKDQNVTIDGVVCKRDIVRWDIGDIPEDKQSLRYSIRVKDPRTYGILDASVQGKLTYDEIPGFTKTPSPLIVQIDEIVLAPKGADDYYVVPQDEVLAENAKVNDDPLNSLIDTSGNSSDSKVTVNGYIAGLDGNYDKANLAGYTTELVNGPKFGNVKLNEDGTFSYVQNGDLYSTDVKSLSPDANGTEQYNAVTTGWEDTFTYKLHTAGFSTKYTTTSTTTTTTTTTGMSFEDVNSVAGDKLCMIVFGDVEQSGADSEGRVIIGGNLTVNGGWAVSNQTNYGDDYALLVGGTISGNPNVAGQTAQGEQWVKEYTQKAYEAFKQLSQKYSEMSNEGSAERNPHYTPQLVLTANPNHTPGTAHVFNVDGSQSIGEVQFKGNFGDDQIIINVSGANHQVSGGQWAMVNDSDLSQGKLAGQTTWNFYQAQSIATENFSFYGSVLAPDAHFSGKNGHINGTLIADSLEGLGGFEYHAGYFFYDTTGTTTTTTTTTYDTTSERIELSEYPISANVGANAENELESKEITVHIRIVPNLNDLSAQKTSVPAPGTTVKSGDEIEYTINVNNPRSIAANGVVVTDVLPLGTSLVEGSISDGGSIDASGKITWSIDLGARSAKAVSFKVRVNDNVTGRSNLSNVALVSFTTPGEDTPKTTTTNTVNHAYISAVKSTDVPEGALVKIGDTINYIITVTNNGSADAYGIEIIDTLPAGLTFAGSDSFKAEGDSLKATIDVLKKGETKNVSFAATVDAFDTGVRTYNNTAAVNGINTNTTEDTAKRGSVTVYHREVGTEKDLTEPVTDNGNFGETYGPYTKGNFENYRYTNIIGSETGTFIDGNIDIIFYYEKIPGSAVVKYVDKNGTEIDTPQTVTGNQGDVLDDLYGKKDTIGNYTYESTDAPTYTLTEEGIVIIHIYKLNVDETLPTVLKSADPATGSLVKSGDVITYTIAVTNNKYEAMNNVVVTDTAPKGTTILSAEGAEVSGNTAAWNIASIAAGETIEVSFQVTVDSTFDGNGNLANIGKVTYTERDATTPTEINTNVTNHAVLVAQKYTGSNARGFYGVGDTINYFIKVKNVGTADAKGVVVNDNVPAGTKLFSGNTSATFDLAAGAEKIVSFSVVINDIDAYSANITNTATVNDVPTNTTEDIVKKGWVVVKYQDVEGNTLADDTVYTGTPGEAHGSTDAIDIPHYTYKTTEGTSEGKFVEGTITIIHIYDKTPAVAVVKYLDKDTDAPIVPSETINGFSGEPIESDLWKEIENWQFIETIKPEMVFTDEGVEIIHYYRFIKPDDTEPSIVKKSDPESGKYVKPGQTVNYTITFTNTRIDTVNDVVISDVIPDGALLVDGSISEGGELNGKTISWSIGTLQPGESATVGFAVAVADKLSGSGNMANTGKATFTDRDGNPEEPVYTNTTKHPILTAELDHTNNQPDAILTEGDEITYIITVGNVGSDTAINVPVTSYIPDGTTFVDSPDMILDENGNVVATIPELEPGKEIELTFTVVIDEFPENVFEEDIPNVAHVDDIETNTVLDHAEVGDVIVRHYDYDGKLLDQFTETNTGRVGTSYGAYIDLVSSNKIENRSLTRIEGNTTGNFIPGLIEINFYYERIPANVVVRYLETGTEEPVKNPESHDGFWMGDNIPTEYADETPISGYNYDKVETPSPMVFDETTEVITHYYTRILDTDQPTIVKSSEPANGSVVNEGNIITYTIKVTNVRATDALAETVISDPIPAGTTYVDGSADNGGELVDGKVVWNIGNLAAGASKTVKFKVKVNEGIKSGINLGNQANVSYRDVQIDQPGSIDSNVTNHALIYSVKTGSNTDGAVLTEGSLISYTVTAINVGSAPVNVTIVDKIPANTKYIAGSVNKGASVRNGTASYVVEALQPGQKAELTFKVQVSMKDSFTADIVNMATVNDHPTNEVTDHAERGTVTTRYFLVEPDGTVNEVTDYNKGIGYKSSGEVGQSFTLPNVKQFENYTFNRAEKSSDSKTYIAGNIEIRYYFERKPVNVVIHYKDIDTKATIAPTKTFGNGEDKFYAGDEFPSIYKEDIEHYEYVSNDAPTKTVLDEGGSYVVVPDLYMTEAGLEITHYYDYIPDSTVIDRSKSVDKGNGTIVPAGSELTYTINVRNPRYDAINNVVVTDPIPAGVTVVDGTVSNDGVVDGNAVKWNLGTLESGASVALTFTVKVNESFTAAGNLSNKATITYDNSDNEPQTPVVTNEVNNAVIISSKQVSADKAEVGNQLTYTINVANYGSVNAENVVVADAVPAGTTLIDGSINNGGSYKDGIVSWSINQLAPGVPAALSFSVIIDQLPDGVYAAQLKNTAVVNNVPTNETTTEVKRGTLTVTHVDENGVVLKETQYYSAPVGTEFTFVPYGDEELYGYDYVSTNVDGQKISSRDAEGNYIEGNIDIVFVYRKGEGVLTVRYLEKDTDKVLYDSYTEVMEIGETVTDMHRVDLLPAYELDEDSTVITPEDLVMVREGIEIIYYYIDIPDTSEILRSKTSDPENRALVAVGDIINYSITVENPRREDIDNITVTDAVPAGCTLVEGSISDNGTLSEGVVVWNIDRLMKGEQRTFTFAVKVNSTFEEAGNLSNTAQVTFTNRKEDEPKTYDTNTVNHAVLVSNKLVSSEAANVGDKLSYTINVTNYGSTEARNIKVTDSIPNGTTYVSDSAKGAAVVEKNGVLTFTIDKLNAGESAALTFDVVANEIANNGYKATIKNVANVNDQPTNSVDTVVTAGTVTIVHIDEDGNVLIPKKTEVGNVGDSYSFKQEEIPGYKYVKTEGEPEGTFIEGNQDVVMIYRKGKGVLTVNYLDKDTNEVISSSYTETMDEGTTVTDLHKKDIDSYIFSNTTKPDSMVMTEDGIIVNHYYTYDPETFTVSGAVWVSNNPNSTFETGDEGYGGIKVILMDGDEVVGSAITDSTGAYTIEDVPAGDYTVEYDVPSTYKVSDALAYDAEMLNSIVDKQGKAAVTVTGDTKNIGMELFETRVLGASDEVVESYTEPEIQTVKVYEKVEPKADNVVYTRVLGDSDAPKTGDSGVATSTAIVLASVSLFVLILCRKGKH